MVDVLESCFDVIHDFYAFYIISALGILNFVHFLQSGHRRTDRQTDTPSYRDADTPSYRDARTHLKTLQKRDRTLAIDERTYRWTYGCTDGCTDVQTDVR